MGSAETINESKPLRSMMIELILFLFKIYELPPEVIVMRNSTGHVLQVRGIAAEVLKWLSDALNFKLVHL